MLVQLDEETYQKVRRQAFREVRVPEILTPIFPEILAH